MAVVLLLWGILTNRYTAAILRTRGYLSCFARYDLPMRVQGGREEVTVRADEATRYLAYLGYETQSFTCVPRTVHPSRKGLLIFVGVVCAVILVGVAAASLRSDQPSTALAQPGQSISDDVPTGAYALSADGPSTSFRNGASGFTWVPDRPRFTVGCVGPWYPILLGLYACPGQ